MFVPINRNYNLWLAMGNSLLAQVVHTSNSSINLVFQQSEKHVTDSYTGGSASISERAATSRTIKDKQM